MKQSALFIGPTPSASHEQKIGCNPTLGNLITDQEAGIANPLIRRRGSPKGISVPQATLPPSTSKTLSWTRTSASPFPPTFPRVFFRFGSGSSSSPSPYPSQSSSSSIRAAYFPSKSSSSSSLVRIFLVLGVFLAFVLVLVPLLLPLLLPDLGLLHDPVLLPPYLLEFNYLLSPLPFHLPIHGDLVDGNIINFYEAIGTDVDSGIHWCEGVVRQHIVVWWCTYMILKREEVRVYAKPV